MPRTVPDDTLLTEDGETETVNRYDPALTGRPPEISRELIDYIARLVRIGNYIDVACAAAGISRQTYYNWAKRGHREKKRVAADARRSIRQDEALYVNFVDTIEKAVAESEARDVLTVHKASQTNWQAAAWKLERKNVGRWGRRSAIEVSGPEGGPLEHITAEEDEATDDPRDRLKNRIERMRQRLVESGDLAVLLDEEDEEDEEDVA